MPTSVSLHNLLAECGPQFHFVTKENVVQGIYQFVEENQPDLLGVIPKEHGLFGSIFHKSESKPLILHPRIPVFNLAFSIAAISDFGIESTSIADNVDIKCGAAFKHTY